MATLRIVIVIIVLCISNCTREAQSPKRQQQVSPKGSNQIIPKFDGQRAFEYLKAQTDFGPRDPGSKGHKLCMEYLYNELKQFSDEIQLQKFSHIGYNGKNLQMANIIASFNTSSSERILLCAHWDTRPRADREPDPKKRHIPILGANDAASGVAVLLEIARLIKNNPPQVGIDIVFFDGEDYGEEGDLKNYLLGSKYFSKNLPLKTIPIFGILLDMIGDKNLEIKREGYSLRFAPDIVDLVWSTAHNLSIHQFVFENQDEIIDDHLPLNQNGIKTINIIDFNYPDDSHRFWHTLEDTPDKCSPESLEAVGTVILHVIYNYSPTR